MSGQSERFIDMKTTGDRAAWRGRDIARKLFEKRGNHAEAHISEIELAALLTIAYEDGAKLG